MTAVGVLVEEQLEVVRRVVDVDRPDAHQVVALGSQLVHRVGEPDGGYATVLGCLEPVGVDVGEVGGGLVRLQTR